VYLINDDLALVQTVDFFTPVVDDPFTFGQIAAANSLSDIYAMGGKPISALSIVGFPEKGDPAILEQIIRGGLDKMKEANCAVIGGHSIRNDDIQFGYAVTGLIDPQIEVRKAGTQVEHVIAQLKGSLAKIPADAVASMVIAYEPVWAIGTGEVASPDDAQEMAAAIRAHISGVAGGEAGAALRILYGGSVKGDNIASIMAERDVDGALVGGASLDAGQFAAICRYRELASGSGKTGR